ncbi:MAG: hypothetical protein GY820_11900 [Gammaproteobacteria bacterium]|nr:hypothetical protein [Gammaproteobacteria bacterium]
MANIDPVTRSFAALENYTNINSHQIIIFDAKIDFRVLQKAIKRAIEYFPLLLARYDAENKSVLAGYWRVTDIPFYFIEYEKELSFSDAGLRQLLTGFSQKHPLKWSSRPPIQFIFICSSIEQKTGFMFNVSHAVADAQSDSFLVDRVAKCYQEIIGEENDNVRYLTNTVNNYSVTTLDFSKFSRRHSLRNRIAGYMREFLKDVFIRIKFSQGRRASPGLPLNIDFYHEILDTEVVLDLKELCKATGHTINTVFLSALCGTLESHQGGKSTKIMCPVSLRKYMGHENLNNYQNYMVPCNIHVSERFSSSNEFIGVVGGQTDQIKKGGLISHLDRLTPMIHLLEKSPSKALASKLLAFFQGSNACYSNPGVMEENYRYFGAEDIPVYQYIGFGCLIEPYDFILYTPTINELLQLNVVYRKDRINDIEEYLVRPVKSLIGEMKKVIVGDAGELKCNAS